MHGLGGQALRQWSDNLLEKHVGMKYTGSAGGSVSSWWAHCRCCLASFGFLLSSLAWLWWHGKRWQSSGTKGPKKQRCPACKRHTYRDGRAASIQCNLSCGSDGQRAAADLGNGWACRTGDAVARHVPRGFQQPRSVVVHQSGAGG